MGKCCHDFLKFLVFIVTFAAFVAAAGLLGLAIYVLIKAEDILGFRVATDLSPDNPTAVHFSILLIFIIVFGFLSLFAFLGCCGAACQNRCMLGSFIIILFIFLGGYIGGVVYVFLSFKDEVDMVETELIKTLRYYNADVPDALVRKFWDLVQPAIGCCGVTSWMDWTKGDTVAVLKQGRQVPASCCKKTTEHSDDCVYSPDSSNAYQTGCLTMVELPYRITFWAIPCVMTVVLMGTLILCSNCCNTRDDEDVVTPRRKPSNGRGGVGSASRGYNARGSETEETGYVFRRTPTPNYPSAPPYNPEYPMHDVADQCGRAYGYSGPAETYPTGVIPPHCEPLIQPPAYHDVVRR